MGEKKKYILGYNRYSNSVIVYSNQADADRSGTWCKVIEAYTLLDAKKELLAEYRNNHTENE